MGKNPSRYPYIPVRSSPGAFRSYFSQSDAQVDSRTQLKAWEDHLAMLLITALEGL